ncbi:hypothetical protein PCASD_11408 [Puccinia coronata f. sp. avenae]|uniref:Uncharacterized protein n=1 Tax=Puccinia coronata f. sp. avenae TaxID=200324 RepID=A0A2N5V115_9BASI|nr:hypothetical protein PCASD_11408 [Puccinia coronata f. sp. avenae]
MYAGPLHKTPTFDQLLTMLNGSLLQASAVKPNQFQPHHTNIDEKNNPSKTPSHPQQPGYNPYCPIFVAPNFHPHGPHFPVPHSFPQPFPQSFPGSFGSSILI